MINYPTAIGTGESLSTFAWHQKSHAISGKLLHPDGDPMTDQKIALYAPGIFWNTKLAETKTDKYGNFNIDVVLKHHLLIQKTQLILKVFEETVPSEKAKIEREVASHTFKLHYNDDKFDVGAIKVELYESQAELPALAIPEDSSKRPQQATLQFYNELLQKGIYKILKGLQFKVFQKITKIEDVISAFPPKGTLLDPVSSTTIELVLNGIYPCHFRQGSNPNELINEINWDKYDKDSSPDLPNTTLTVEKKNGTLVVKNVEIQYPGQPSVSYDMKSKGIYRAFYLYNSMGLIKGESVYHLGIGHLITGQIALSFFRHINNHPIYNLLRPHLDGVAEINRLGAGLIFGEGGILNVSGLSSKGVDQLLDDTLAAFDPATFKPRAPITETHHFAKAQLLFWDIVTATVDRYFEENKDAISSPEHWYEIFDMAKHLTNHSRPYKPFDNTGVMKDAPWDDPSEFGGFDLNGRVEYGGQIRAIRPITTNREVPVEGDIERLKQFCRYTLFLSTFYHWAIHTSQFQWMTNLKAGSLAPEGYARAEYGGTKPLNAARQLEVASILVDFEAPALVDNPFGMIYQPFIDNILAKKDEFHKLNYDITKMHYGVII